MTDQQLADKMAQIIRVGFVNARQPEKMRVKVTIPDTTGSELVTDFLPVLCPRACEDMQYDLPDIGDQVLCLFLSYGLEQGFVIGSMYGKQTPPVQNGDKWHRKFKDGTFLEYDRAQHKLVASVQGDVKLFATGSVTGQIQKDLSASVQGSMSAKSQGPAQLASASSLALDAPSMNMGGGGDSATAATMQGTFHLTNGDIIAEVVSLRNHVHICPACGAQTSPPVGSGSTASGSALGENDGSSGSEYGNGNGETGDLDHDKGGSESGNSGNGESGSTGEKPGLELFPAFSAALAATGFIWTENDAKQFEETKKLVFEQDNEVFDTILCLPSIAEAEAKRTSGADRLGWLYLKQMFEKWLSGKARTDPFANNEPFWVSMDWALTYYRVKYAWFRLTLYSRLFSKNAQKELFNSIKKARLASSKPEEFKFCETDWRLWKAYYFQEYDVYGMVAFPPDGLMAAMGDFKLRALADGVIRPTATGYHISVKKVGIIIWDSFNFDDNQAMEYWSCAHQSFQGLDPDEAVYLYNSSFRAFQEQIKMGNDFLVLSEPKMVDDFEGYEYDIII